MSERLNEGINKLLLVHLSFEALGGLRGLDSRRLITISPTATTNVSN